MLRMPLLDRRQPPDVEQPLELVEGDALEV
jgi:hypothetical protein